MDALLSFSQTTGIHAFMHTAWGWPVVESLHFIGLSLLVGTVGVFDLRMMGLATGIPMSALHRLVPWGVAGYGLNVVTGFMFLSSAPDQYLYNPAFQVKLALMGLAGINLIFFYVVRVRSGQGGRRGSDRSSRRKNRGSHLVELLGWCHRMWPSDYLFSPTLPLVLLVPLTQPHWSVSTAVVRTRTRGDRCHV